MKAKRQYWESFVGKEIIQECSEEWRTEKVKAIRDWLIGKVHFLCDFDATNAKHLHEHRIPKSQHEISIIGMKRSTKTHQHDMREEEEKARRNEGNRRTDLIYAACPLFHQ